MTDRHCPFCGELVSSNAVTCPRCFRSIPPDPVANRQTERRWDSPGDAGRPEHGYRRSTALLLNAVPGLIGILGLGQIYRDRRSPLGYIVLAVGLVLFATAAALAFSWGPNIVLNVLKTLSAFPVAILYGVVYVFSLLDILFGRLVHMNRGYRRSEIASPAELHDDPR